MQVFGLVEMLEIQNLPRRSFLKIDFEERVAFWRGVQVLTGSLSSKLGKMSTTGANCAQKMREKKRTVNP